MINNCIECYLVESQEEADGSFKLSNLKMVDYLKGVERV